MGTYNHSDKSTYSLLGGLRGLISAVIVRLISALKLQVGLSVLRLHLVLQHVLQGFHSAVSSNFFVGLY